MSFDGFDLPILRFLTRFVGGWPLADHLIQAISRSDILTGTAMMALVWFAWFQASADMDEVRRTDRQGWILIVSVGGILTMLLAGLLQYTLTVHRPPIVAGLGLTFPIDADLGPANSGNSFPSVDATLFCALSIGLLRLDRRLGTVAFAWTFIVIELPQVCLGLLYPSDVLAGAVLGILCMEIFIRLPVWRPALRILAWSRRRPGLFYGLAFLLTEQLAHPFGDLLQWAFALLGRFFLR